MKGSAVYGFFLGVAVLLFTRAAPQPAGSILLWGFFAVHLMWGAVLCWRGTALPFATLAMGIASGTSGLLATLAAAGYVFPDLPPLWWAPVSASLLSTPLMFLIESRIHREKWTQWKEYMERKNAWEILTGRHIPPLRKTGGGD
jgi:hypothetical protein